jgi:RNA-binding protein YlmH
MTGHRNLSLEARLEDYVSFSEKGRIAVSSFLTPGERKQAERFLTARGCADRAIFWGGYAEAERTCLFLLPDFYAEIEGLMPPPDTDPAETLSELDGDAVAAVRIRGSGFRTLSHRDYLGSILGLGVERDAIGDIAVQSDCEAVAFCRRGLRSFLIENLTKAASDTVRCSEYTLEESFTDGRRYAPISDTVASPRLDCVVAALTNLSREDAQQAVRTGLVEVDFEPEERTDCTLTPPVTVSVRGYGRYILRAFDGETKKGRLRLRADRLV